MGILAAASPGAPHKSAAAIVDNTYGFAEAPLARKPEEYHKNLMTYVGTAAGTLGWAVGGLTVGGLLALGGMLVSPDSGVFPVGFVIACGVGALIGGAIGGQETYSSIIEHDHNKQARKVDETFGRTVDGSAKELIGGFDMNGNHQIERLNPSGLPLHDERISIRSSNSHESYPDYRFFDDHWNIHGSNLVNTWHISAANIWRAADTNNDNVVKFSEMTALLKKFDKDNSGALTVAERTAFNKAHPMTSDAPSEVDDTF